MTLKCPKCGSADLDWVEEWSICHMTYPIKIQGNRLLADLSIKAMNWGTDGIDDIDRTYVRCRKCKTEFLDDNYKSQYERGNPVGKYDEIVRRGKDGS
jgi:hypothetical protein